MFNIIIDHQPVFKKGAGFSGYTKDGNEMSLSIVDHTTATLTLVDYYKNKHNYQIPLSTKDEWDKFCETDFNGRQLEETKSSYFKG